LLIIGFREYPIRTDVSNFSNISFKLIAINHSANSLIFFSAKLYVIPQ
jgi:hypothetical protein